MSISDLRLRPFFGASIAVAIMLFISAFGLPWSGDEAVSTSNSADDTIHRVFSVGEGGSISITSDRGSIEVIGEERDHVEVEVQRDARSSEIADRFAVEFEQDGSAISVNGSTDGGVRDWIGLRSVPDVHFRVLVPRHFNASLETQGGSVTISDLSGDFNVRTAGGSLTFGEIEGAIEGRTSGGSISVAGIQGVAELRTAGGNIDLSAVRGDVDARTAGGSISMGEVAGSVHARTSGGTISVASIRELTGDSEMRTAGGSITVSVGSSAHLEVDAATNAGSINSNLGLNIDDGWASASMAGMIGNGGSQLVLRTAAGSISINQE